MIQKNDFIEHPHYDDIRILKSSIIAYELEKVNRGCKNEYHQINFYLIGGQIIPFTFNCENAAKNFMKKIFGE